MQRSLYLLFLSILCLLFFVAHASAYEEPNGPGGGVFCVNDTIGGLAADFQAVLDKIDIADNTYDADAEVRLLGGETLTIPSSAIGHFNVTTKHSLEISGGWDTTCTPPATGRPTILMGRSSPVQTSSGGILSITIDNNSVSENVILHDLTFSNGYTAIDGGGLYIKHTDANAEILKINLYDFIAESNFAGAFGAGAAILDEATPGGIDVNISDCIVQGNRPLPSGSTTGPGGIAVIGAFAESMRNTTISNCQIIGNTSNELGGGLYIDSGTGNTTLVNNVIAKNIVSLDFGGGVFISNQYRGDIFLTNNTITGNTSQSVDVDHGGGGLYVELFTASSTIDLYNNIIFNNAAASGTGDDIYIYLDSLTNPVTIHNNDFDTTPDTGFYINDDSGLNDISIDNLTVDPEFENTIIDNYRLKDISPVIDQGDNSAPFVPGDDLDGVIRPQNSTVDMGAYEFLATTTTTTTTSTTTTTTTLLPDPPIVTTGSATDISTSAATLEGQVNPNNGSTTYYFEYGLTTSYGSETDEIPDLTGNIAIDVSEDIENLDLNTTYHYRLVAYNSGGTSEGANRSFTTPEKNTPKAGGEGCFIDTAINGY
jgi:hypothetical protein